MRCPIARCCLACLRVSVVCSRGPPGFILPTCHLVTFLPQSLLCGPTQSFPGWLEKAHSSELGDTIPQVSPFLLKTIYKVWSLYRTSCLITSTMNYGIFFFCIRLHTLASVSTAIFHCLGNNDSGWLYASLQVHRYFKCCSCASAN